MNQQALWGEYPEDAFRAAIAELQRAFIASVEQQKALLERISRVQVRAAS